MRWSASRRAPTPPSSARREALLARQGRRKYNTVALDEHGDVVACTDIATTVHEPGRAYQWGTLVRPDARGHRLGLAVKVANLRLLATQRPDLTELITYNAEVNSHMVAVNDRLGFRPVAWLGEFQKRLDPRATSEQAHPGVRRAASDRVGGGSSARGWGRPRRVSAGRGAGVGVELQPRRLRARRRAGRSA